MNKVRTEEKIGCEVTTKTGSKRHNWSWSSLSTIALYLFSSLSAVSWSWYYMSTIVFFPAVLEPESFTWQLEHHDDALVTSRGLWTGARCQDCHGVRRQRVLARVLPRILHHILDRCFIHICFTFGKNFIMPIDIFYEWLVVHHS